MSETVRLQKIAEMLYPSKEACCGNKQRILMQQADLIRKYLKALSTLTEEERLNQLTAWEEAAKQTK